MSWKTGSALFVFCFLAMSMLSDRSDENGHMQSQEDKATQVSYDFALTSRELMFSEAFKPIDSNEYLIPSASFDELNSHSAEVILRSLAALPDKQSSNVILSRKNLEASDKKEL